MYRLVARTTSLLASSSLAFATLLISGPLTPTVAADDATIFKPDDLVVSRSVYRGTESTVTVGELLPPNCPATAKCGGTNSAGVPASDNGLFPAVGSNNNVWNNDTVDSSFGVTSPIFLDEMTPQGRVVNTVPIDSQRLVTSFSSKSELALNLSKDRGSLTFMGYVAPVNTLDASNANTPGVVDPTNPVGENVFRAVAELTDRGELKITDTNAYSGNNGRAAIKAGGLYYAVGNDNNGSGTPANLTTSTGAELIVPGAAPGVLQMIGNFSITQYNDNKPDKAGKDNNFRGLTVFHHTLFVTKGSGSNGINTVYQVGATGTLPTAADAASAPITILPGFPTGLAKNAGAENPFGIFFANANTLYVADEGDGTAADAATSPFAGLQKWTRDSSGTWHQAYVLQNGLHLGQPYGVRNYPTSLDPSPDGLRNITGRVTRDGRVEIWAVTSTVSANGDQGADPNQLVFISDELPNTDPLRAAQEHFELLRAASYGEVLRGVSFTPHSRPARGEHCDERACR